MRAFGARRVRLRTSDGATFDGHILQEPLSDAAAVLLFACDNETGEPLVVPLEGIESLEER